MDRTTFEIRLAGWIPIVESCQSRPSGQTISQWCKEAGIGEKQYYYWQRRVRSYAAMQTEPLLPTTASATEVTFAEVKISDHQKQMSGDSPSNESIPGFNPEVLIRKGNLMIGITNKVSDRLLGRILQEVSHAG